MNNHSKIAVVGGKDDIEIFRMFSFDTYVVHDHTEAVEQIKSFGKSKEDTKAPFYAIVFVMENFISEFTEKDYRKISEKYLPAVVPLPSSMKSEKFGLKRLSQLTEKAVGINVMK